MVRADDLVAIGHIRHRSKKQGPVVGQVLEEVVVVVGHDLHMLESQFVCHRQHLCVLLTDDHAAVVGPGLSSDVGGGQVLELTFHFGDGVQTELARGSQ